MIRLKLTNRKRMPWLYILDKPAKLWDLKYYKYIQRIREFSKQIERVDGNRVTLKDGWVISVDSAELNARELPEWKYYVPISFKGLDVLDCGAGCGETARYYFQHGARKVLCLDNDPVCIGYLEENAKSFPIEVIRADFSVDALLSYDYDFCKIDVEGYEALLVEALREDRITISDLRPTVIEAHSHYCIDELKKYGFKTVWVWRPDLEILTNLRA